MILPLGGEVQMQINPSKTKKQVGVSLSARNVRSLWPKVTPHHGGVHRGWVTAWSLTNTHDASGKPTLTTSHHHSTTVGSKQANASE